MKLSRARVLCRFRVCVCPSSPCVQERERERERERVWLASGG